jgi:HlyD family secretion protein
MKKILRLTAVVALLGVVGYTLYFLYQKSAEKPLYYKTEAPFITSIYKKTIAAGSILPRKEILIKPQVSGIIDELYVEPGDEVRKGQLIARIKIIPDMAQLNNAENRVRVAQLNLDNAKRNYDRFKDLFEKGVVAEAEFQDVELAYKNALTELDAAENNLQIIEEGASKKSGESANTLIRSTSDGMVLDIPVEEGNSVIEANTFNEGTTIATIADLGEMIFEGKVDESEVGKISAGMPLIVSVGAIQGTTFNAELEYISPKGVEENGAIQFEIKADVELKEDFFIRAGYSANADIVLEKREDVLAIRESLLQFDGRQPYVEVETGEQSYERKDVKIGLSDGIQVEILEGLSEDDKVKVWNKPMTEEMMANQGQRGGGGRSR